MVFQKSNPFPKSIFETSHAARINRIANGRADLSHRVEESLKAAALWDEVKDRLHEPALSLSGAAAAAALHRACPRDQAGHRADGRAGLGARPDRHAAHRRTDLPTQRSVLIVIVTHNMQQAARVSDFTAFFWLGRLVECNETRKIFTAPAEKLTEDYVTGRFG